MGKNVVPEQVTYFCDSCGKESKTPFDCRLTININCRDYQGHAVGGQQFKKDLCGGCVTKLDKALATTEPEDV